MSTEVMDLSASSLGFKISAIARGGLPAALASIIAALVAKSPCALSRGGSTTKDGTGPLSVRAPDLTASSMGQMHRDHAQAGARAPLRRWRFGVASEGPICNLKVIVQHAPT